jgi:ABC-type xylose transport system permease subunit
MIFWVGILVSGLFAHFAIKKGFYEMWALGFNIIISIYLAVLLGPVVSDIIPVGTAAYSKVLTMLGTAIACFLILHGISYTFITGQFSIPLPKIVDVVGAGIFGFLIGFLVWSFVCLLIMTTPITKNNLAKEIGFDTKAQQTNASYVSWWCNKVNKIVSSVDNKQATQQAISWFLESSKPKAKALVTDTSELNEPAEPNGTVPNTTEKQ